MSGNIDTILHAPRFTANKKGPSLPTVRTLGPFDDDSVINYDNAAAASVDHDLFAVGWLMQREEESVVCGEIPSSSLPLPSAK